MSSISTYKKQFKDANKALARNQARTLEITQQMQELQKKKEEAIKQVEEDKNQVVTKGIYYYDLKKRKQLLEDAEYLRYPKSPIETISCIDDKDWNADNVDYGIITELQAMESFVKENLPDYSRGFFAKIGKLMSGGEKI